MYPINKLSAQDSLVEKNRYYGEAIGASIGSMYEIAYKFIVQERVGIEIRSGKYVAGREGFHTTIAIMYHQKSKYENTYTYFGGGFIKGHGISKYEDFGLILPLGYEILYPPSRIAFFVEIRPIVFYSTEDNRNFTSFFSPKEPSFSASAVIGLRYIFHR